MNKKLHICFISGEYPLWRSGGVGTFLQTLGTALVRKGHKVTILGIGEESKTVFLKDNGVEIIRLSKPKIPKARFIESSIRIRQKIKEIHKKNRIDIVETAELGLAFINKIRGIKYVIRMHGGHHFFTNFENRKRETKKVFQEKLSFKKADAYIAVSDYVGYKTFDLMNLKNKSYEVIYNPIDTSKFYESDVRKEVPRQLLFFGTVCEKKGIRQLTLALPLIRQKFSDVNLMVVGRDWRFPDSKKSYTDMLKNEIVTEEIRENITFIGEVSHSDVSKYIESSEICILPSHMEAMPLAWLEVLAMGKAFVGSNIGPGLEAVESGKTGLLCDPHDFGDIAEKVNWMLANPKQAKEMGTKARNNIKEKFDVNVIVDENINFYRSLLQ